VKWRVRVTVEADTDFEGILHWTMDRFGADQSSIYAETIRSALRALGTGPQTPGAMARQDLEARTYMRSTSHGPDDTVGTSFCSAPRSGSAPCRSHDAMDIKRHLDE